ncbi:NepR family anti-sigma factor [Palleronia sp. LCG004]|uniref:NepR family anti-sigma factor n=1 Tax=Palleronia sp. LCG004 TaxID=3079304 RepID=UPI002941FB65|nr:NepR family anti-sigma factor [Palleronia sp. LCG004]WOI56006.1 NepR family anti-sigma factor [Palleronia sp. LCG004]
MTSEKKTSNVKRQIDENLRRVYQQDSSREIPDRFKKLLDDLKSADNGNEPQERS